jgi:hypothetical protein
MQNNLLLPLKTGKSNIFNQEGTVNSDSVKQILIGQRALKSGKWESENGQCQH